MSSNKRGRDEMGRDPEPQSPPYAESAGGAALGAALGYSAGPGGAMVGATLGGLLGWINAQGSQLQVDVQSEISYWKENYKDRPYCPSSKTWDDFEPAYVLGIYFYLSGRDYEEVRATVESRWHEVQSSSSLTAQEASDAARDAWKRLSLAKR